MINFGVRRGGNTPLHMAVGDNDIDMFHALLASGADMDAVNGVGETSLHYAAREGYIEMVHELIAFGSNVHAVTENGDTPLHLAADRDYVDPRIIEMLIASGANVNVPNNDGNTALHMAARSGHIYAIRPILAGDANVNAVNIANYTPIVMAQRSGYDMVAVMLHRLTGVPLPPGPPPRPPVRPLARLPAPLPLANNENIGGHQSVHNAAVHKFASEGASYLKNQYSKQDIAKARHECIDWVNSTDNQTAKDAMAWIRNSNFKDKGVDKRGHRYSNVSFKKLIGLVWLGIHNKQAIKGLRLKDADIIERKQTLIKRLYDIQNAYNERGRSCAGGAFNMFISTLSGGHDGVSFIFISGETIALKAKALLQNCFERLSDVEKQNILKGWKDDSQIPRKILESLKPTIEQQLRDEFHEFKDCVLDPNYRNYYEDAIKGAIDALQYLEMPKCIKDFKEKNAQQALILKAFNRHRQDTVSGHRYPLRDRNRADEGETDNSSSNRRYPLRNRVLHSVRKT